MLVEGVPCKPKGIDVYHVQRVQGGMEAIGPRLHMLRCQHRTSRQIDRKKDVTYSSCHTGTPDSNSSGYNTPGDLAAGGSKAIGLRAAQCIEQDVQDMSNGFVVNRFGHQSVLQ